MVHEVRAQVAPDLRAGVFSGPSFALEVARGQPTALVAASEHAEVREALVAAFHGASLRVYASDDMVGVEVGGAVKNVMAIAAGLCDGLQLGLNARAALITRGLAEITRLGVALGARAETFTGLSGLGDLVLTATGDLSRNRKVGLLLAAGQNPGRSAGVARPCGRRRLLRPHRGAARRQPGRGHADCAKRGGLARRQAQGVRGGGAADGARAEDGTRLLLNQ